MKRLALAVLTLAMMVSTNVYGQGKYGRDSAECIKYLSYYTEYYKQKNYDEALPSWRKAYKLCPPTASENMFVQGSTLLRRLIQQNANNAAYRDALVDSLMTLHDTRMQAYPRRAVSVLNTKGLDIHNYIKGNPEAVYKMYEEIIGANKGETGANLFLFELDAATELVQAGKLDPEQFINIYQRNLEYIKPEDGKKEELEALFITSKVASCENLLELFTPRFNASPNDATLISNIVKMLSITEGCQNNDLYLKAVTAMHANEPSATSAYYLFKLNSSRGNNADAVRYMEEAINSADSDAKTDAQYNYELAVFCSKANMNAKGIECARRAIELDAENYTGKGNFLIGTIWGSTVCSGNEIERRAPYWVAVDYLQRAKAADPTLTDDANRLIGQYAAYFPQTAEAFMYDVTDGQSYTVSCGGMRATTTVRTQK